MIITKNTKNFQNHYFNNLMIAKALYVKIMIISPNKKFLISLDNY